MSLREEVTAVLEGMAEAAAPVRDKLLARRKEILDELTEIDGQLARLPQPRPGTWAERRQRLQVIEVGRAGLPLNSRDVIHATAAFYGTNVNTITGTSRHMSVARARHVAMFLARKFTRESFPEIGRAFGLRDHTTVISAVQKIEVAIGLEDDAQLGSEVREIERRLLEKVEEPRKEAL